MNIAGFQKLSLQDFPGKVACIVFTQGCNFRCGFCHNPELIPFENDDLLDTEETVSYIKERKGMLDGVVITGGEPTLQKDLEGFLRQMKEIGLAVKLDTNGNAPDVLKDLIDKDLIDYIAMDYKYPLDHYKEIVRSDASEKIKKSKELIESSGIDHEFRVTVVPDLFTDNIIEQMSKELENSKVILQAFNNEVVLDKKFRNYRNTTEKFLEKVKERFNNAVIR